MNYKLILTTLVFISSGNITFGNIVLKGNTPKRKQDSTQVFKGAKRTLARANRVFEYSMEVAKALHEDRPVAKVPSDILGIDVLLAELEKTKKKIGAIEEPRRAVKMRLPPLEQLLAEDQGVRIASLFNGLKSATSHEDDLKQLRELARGLEEFLGLAKRSGDAANTVRDALKKIAEIVPTDSAVFSYLDMDQTVCRVIGEIQQVSAHKLKIVRIALKDQKKQVVQTAEEYMKGLEREVSLIRTEETTLGERLDAPKADPVTSPEPDLPPQESSGEDLRTTQQTLLQKRQELNRRRAEIEARNTNHQGDWTAYRRSVSDAERIAARLRGMTGYNCPNGNPPETCKHTEERASYQRTKSTLAASWSELVKKNLAWLSRLHQEDAAIRKLRLALGNDSKALERAIASLEVKKQERQRKLRPVKPQDKEDAVEVDEKSHEELGSERRKLEEEVRAYRAAIKRISAL